MLCDISKGNFTPTASELNTFTNNFHAHGIYHRGHQLDRLAITLSVTLAKHINKNEFHEKSK